MELKNSIYIEFKKWKGSMVGAYIIYSKSQISLGKKV